MKKLFQKWIFAVVALTFLVVFGISFAVNTRQARLSALSLIHLKLDDASAQLDNAVSNLERITRMSEEAVLLRTRLFAAAVAQDGWPRDDETFARLLQELDVDELYDFAPDGSLRGVFPREIAQEEMQKVPASSVPREGKVITMPTEHLQYAAMPRPDRPGTLVVGDKPERLHEAEAIADIRNFSEGFRIGLNGGVLIARDGALLCDGMLDLHEKKLGALGFPMPLPSPGESFRITLEGTHYLGALLRHGEYTLIGLQPEKEVFYRRNLAQSMLVIVYLVLFALIYALIALLLKKIVLNGLDDVCDSLQKITGGDLEEMVDVHSCREFEFLSGGINSTVTALRNTIAEAARRLDGELALARAIQRSALPRDFSSLPGCGEFSLYATMTPAREVGGDFYDFFPIGGNHIAFLVADVSEKGIPAALFMMTGKTWIKGLSLAGLPPEKVFTEANRMLSVDNPEGMFITVFFGLLELSTGKLLCVNAGHNPPLLRRRGGNYEYLRMESDFLLGTLPDVDYTAREILLAPGDRLFLYTDGVTEAQNPEGALFGTETLRELLNESPRLEPRQTVEKTSERLAAFIGSAAQYDDITMLAIAWRANAIELAAEAERLPELQRFVEEQCAGCKAEVRTHALIATEEIFLNIASYAYPGSAGSMRLACREVENMLFFEFSDGGVPYNPLEAPEPKFAESADELAVGGMGIFITRTIADRLEYRRENNRNILSVGFSTENVNE